MNYQQLTIDQIKQLNEIYDPIARRRFGVLFQLPQDIQDTFVSDDSTHSIWNITREKYNLPNRSISATARIIGLILLGELPIKNFIIALQNDLDIDLETAQAIAQEINMAIFQPIRESLMFIHNIGGKTGTQTGDTNTRMHANDTNKNAQVPNNTNRANSEERMAYRLQNQNKSPIRYINPQANQNQGPDINQQPNLKDEYYDYEVQRKREDIINRAKTQQQQQPPPPNRQQSNQQARPAMLRMLPKKNIVDLRVLAKKKYKKNHYDGFFSA